MTNKEQNTIDSLHKLVSDLAAENRVFKAQIDEKTTKLEKQVNATYLPVNLEQEVLRTAQQAIGDSIKSVLTGYSSPLTKFVAAVVEENGAFLKGVISDSFNKVIRTEDFKQSIINAFSHKVARTIISNNDGLFDKVSNELKQDTIFKSKMALAVSNVVEECLKSKS